MLSPTAKYTRRTTWAIAGLQAGAALFIGGLVVLHFNPFWQFDESGFLDWRVHWWNAAGEILTAAGLSIEALSVVGWAALAASNFFNRRWWPYAVAVLLLFCVVLSAGVAGFTRDLNAHFEWNAADGFNVFHLQGSDDAAPGRWAENPVWKSIIEIQIQPLLRGYFKANDWQKMNGDIGVRVVRILPVAWPIALGGGGETLEDPDETALMKAAAQEDLEKVQQLLSGITRADINALDQDGQTALILACRNPEINPAVIKALLAAGADVNLRSRNGYAALTWARSRNNGEVIGILRKAGGRP